MFMHTDEALSAIPHIRHAFLGRTGGVSAPPYESLNIGYSTEDKKSAIQENRKLICDHLKTDGLFTCQQVHGADIISITPDSQALDTRVGDGMITQVFQKALGILTADCAPVLIADVKRPIIGAAHAGWGGAFKGIVQNLIHKMLEAGAQSKDLVICIGPCIHQASYEVGPDFYQRFIESNTENKNFFKKAHNAGHMLFNLPLYIQSHIKNNLPNIGHISVAPYDTYLNKDLFFSHRRATHHTNGLTGRQMSVIMLKP